ncbi:hypothetical protein KM043_012855 [Ampulex compressa]|nr:hypothetical protein KM043_012855 [Ampulex compressa]
MAENSSEDGINMMEEIDQNNLEEVDDACAMEAVDENETQPGRRTKRHIITAPPRDNDRYRSVFTMKMSSFVNCNLRSSQQVVLC